MRPTLTKEAFLTVVDSTPLVSIDLIVRDRQHRTLLGLRINEPARGTWFVPGGRIRKGEPLDEAFSRISDTELGVAMQRASGRFLGVFTHRYDTNFSGACGIATHYVVLAYELEISLELKNLPRTQHSDFQWWAASDAAKTESVHPNNLPYFLLRNSESLLPTKSAVWIAQYELINNRRNSFNQLLWQAPSLSLTAQAFLFSIVFSKDVNWQDQTLTAGLALVAAIASVLLLIKHRFGEKEMGVLATQMEQDGGYPAVNDKKTEQEAHSNAWYVRQSSFNLWLLLLLLFGVTSFAVILKNVFTNVLGGS